MTQIHVVLRRVNPALDVDFVQVGCIKDGQFSPLPLDTLVDTPAFDYFLTSDISNSPYIRHQSVAALVATLASYPKFSVEFFDNTLILIFDFNIDCNESPSEEERKGN
jgi:hypothetical protein